ncbi:MAG: SLC13 family permease [Promethearchaeati archaeon SRVP18_Atabeyarchaeia-1]
MDPIGAQLTAIVIFLFTFALILTGGRARSVAGLLGGFLMLTAGIFTSIEEVVSYISIETIVVLFGIMVLVGALREGQFFDYIGAVVLNRVGPNPTRLFYVFILLTAVLSAFLDSVAVVLFMLAVTIQLSDVLKFDPKPLMIAEILAANIAGTATTIGDPPNIMISLNYGINFSEFIINMAPLAILSLVALLLFLRWRYGKQLRTTKVNKRVPVTRPSDLITDRKTFLLGSSMFITFLILLIFSNELGLSPAEISLGAAATLLFLGGKKLTFILEHVEWSTLLFFGSIFIVVGGLRKSGVIASLSTSLASIIGNNMLLAIIIVVWLSALGSAFVGNIPFAVTMLPLVQGIATATSLPVLPLLWSLVLGCDIGGSATIIGTAAGVVASDMAEQKGHRIGHKEYLKDGLSTVLLVVGLGTIFLIVRYGLFTG